MSNQYNINAVNKTALANNLGLTYDKLVKYRHSDVVGFKEYYDFIVDEVYGKKGQSEGYLMSTLTGQPILNRYAELSYKDDSIGFDVTLMLQALVITVERSKNIVKNSVLGLNGTVKEYVGTGDHIITITGTIASDNRYLYPDDELISLIDLCNVKDAISISNDYLNKLWQVNSIVVETFSLAQSDKYSNVILYTLNCLSDYPDNKIII